MGDLPLGPLALSLTAEGQGLSSNLILFKLKSLGLLVIRHTRWEETESPSPKRLCPEFKREDWNSKAPDSRPDLVSALGSQADPSAGTWRQAEVEKNKQNKTKLRSLTLY